MFYIYIILGLLVIHCTMYYLNIDVFNLLTRSKSENDNINVNLDNVHVDNSNVANLKVPNLKVANVNVDNVKMDDDLSTSIETSINELKNLNQYIDNELGQTSFY